MANAIATSLSEGGFYQPAFSTKICLLLFPATAQPGTVQIGQMTFRS